MQRLPSDFRLFIEPDCNRLNFIQQYLETLGITSVPIPVEDKTHIYIKFPLSAYNAQFRIKTVIAHYDRVEGSPGANDNSAAVFAIMNWAARLAKKKTFHNVRIIFTDGEEMGTAGVKNQGSFALAQLFKKLNISNNDVYVFDCMGRGEVPVLARTSLPAGMHGNFSRQFSGLYDRAKKILTTACPASWIELPVPYSDNAGFLACGVPAVAFTMLPKEEATEYLQNLFRYKDLEKAVMNSKTDTEQGRDPVPDFMYREKMPYTWRLLHTQFDNELSLTLQSFAVFDKILDELAGNQSL